MTLGDTVLTINGAKVNVTNVEMQFDKDYDETTVTVEGRLTDKKAPENIRPMWWGGVDCAKGKDQMVFHHAVGRNWGKTASVNYKIDDSNITQVNPDNTNWVKRAFENAWEYEGEAVTKGVEKMCNEESTCDERPVESSYHGTALALKLKELELTDDQRKLRKYGLINEVGLLTSKGKEVLLNQLLRAYTDDIVEELNTLEETQKATEEE